MKKPHLLLISAFSASLVFISPHGFSATELYQWVDENGVKHFSQQPPAHMPDLKAMEVRSTSVVSEDKYEAPSKQAVSTATNDEPSQQFEVEQAPSKDKTQCEKARQNIAQIQQYGRMRSKDPKTGEVSYLSEEKKQSQLQRWKDLEDIYC